MKSSLRTFLAALLIASPLTAPAELIVKASESRPAGGSVLLEVERRVETGASWRWFRTGKDEHRARRDVGQIFVAPGEGESVSIGALFLRVGETEVSDGAHGAEIALSFYEYVDGVPAEPPLTVEKGTLPGHFLPKDYLLLQFPSVVLKPGKQYAFVLSYEAPTANRSFNLYTAPAKAYKEGNGLFYGSKPDTKAALEFYEVLGNLTFTLLAP